MSDAHRWTPNPDFTLENFGNEILLYSVIGARAIYLNDTAFLLYRACGAGQSTGEIIAQLEAAYPEQQATIRDEVITALNQLVESGVLIPYV